MDFNFFRLKNVHFLFTFQITYIIIIIMPGSKGQKAVRACTIKLLNFGTA